MRLFSTDAVSAHYLSLKPFTHCPEATAHDTSVVALLDALMACDYRGRFEATQWLKQLDLPDSWREVFTLWSTSNVYKVSDVATKLLDMLKANPADVVTYQILHMLYFLSGQYKHYVSIAHPDLLVDIESDVLRGYYEGVIAFEHAENGIQDVAQRRAEVALSLNHDDIYAIHAGVHALQYQGRHADAEAWLKKDAFWANNKGMNMHVCWHLALAEMVQGNLTHSFTTFKRLQDMKPDPNSDHDLDFANFFWRMYCLHPDKIAPYSDDIQKVADSWANAIGGSMSYFNDIHAVQMFTLTGQVDLIDKLIFIRENGLPTDICPDIVALLQGLRAFAIQDYDTCATKLLATKPMWSRIGGSWAQREVLDYALLVALKRAGRDDDADALCQKSPVFVNSPVLCQMH